MSGAVDDALRGADPVAGCRLVAATLRTGLRILPRGPGEVQIGTDPRWAVRITDLLDDEVAALLAHPPAAPLGLLAADERLSPTRLAALIQQLDEARLLLPDPPPRDPSGPSAADAAVLTLTLPTGTGADVVAARRDRCVGVVGLGRTGLGVALALACAGVGRLRLEDDRPVRSSDVGPAGYGWADVGMPRCRAAARVVADEVPGADVPGGVLGPAPAAGGPPGRGLDLLLVVADGALDPALGVGLLAAGTPHLPIVLREADVLVGPLVVGGDGPCARCLDLHRADADPGWPATAAALAAPPAASPEPVVVASVAAGLAAAAALTFLDDVRTHPAGQGSPRPLRGVTLEVRLPDAVPRERRWAVHPACGCTALSASSGGSARSYGPAGTVRPGA